MRPTVAALATTALLASCAAPDPIVLADTGVDTGVDTGDVAAGPSIRILYPEVGPSGQVELELAADCSIDQLFVFDVDHFELLPAATRENTEGQGHIHLTVASAYLATDTSWVSFTASDVSPASDLVPDAGQFGILSASLQENNHDDLDRVRFPDSIHTLEYVVTDPTGSCL